MHLATLPLLVSALTLGTIFVVVFFVSTVILTIPVFASRGRAQLLWLAGVGFVLTVEVAVLITFVALESGGGGASDSAATPEAVSTEPVSAITVGLRDNFFAPKTFTVKVGTEVTITTKNEGTVPHNMRVLSKDQEGQEFVSDLIVASGKESVFTVKFTKAGTIAFQCDYHVPDMVGAITVVE